MEQLKNALISIVQEVCEMLQGREVPMRNWTCIESIGNGQRSFLVVLRPDTIKLMKELFPNWNNLPSVTRLHELIVQNQTLSSLILIDAAGDYITNDAAKKPWIISKVVSPLTVEYFSKIGAFSFEPNTANSLIDGFINKITDPITSYSMTSPLINLELTMDTLDIAPGLKLQNLCTDQIEKWINDPFFPITAPPLSGWRVEDLKCAVVIKNESSYNSNQAESLIRNLVGLVRLLTDRNVYVAFTEGRIQDRNRPFNDHTVTSWGHSLRLHCLTATIDDTTGTRLINLWNHLQSGPNAKMVALAFKRWSDTAERLADEDKLIDYWVALESLFSTDSNQEVKFRSSLRIAAFLGKTPDKRKEVYNDMRNSYDWRSAIVHGAYCEAKKLKELNKKCSLHQSAKKTRAYLRESILQLLESKEQIDPTGFELQLLGEVL